jgi:hypothetical protein
MVLAGSFNVSNCAYGVVANAGGVVSAQLSTSTWSGTATTYGLMSRYGGTITTSSTTNPTLTGTTADLALDNGDTTGSIASVLTASKSGLTAPITGSRVVRQ